MKILKKWDLIYWIVFVAFIVWKTSMSPDLYTTSSPFGEATFGMTMFWGLCIYIVPAIFIWAVLKVVQKLVEKKKAL